MKARNAWIVALVALALPLAGCLGSAGPAPTDQNVAHAVRAVVLADNAAPATATSAGTAARAFAVTRVRNLGCNPAPDYKGYLCETVIDTRSAKRGPHQKTRLVRMVHGTDGWQATMQ